MGMATKLCDTLFLFSYGISNTALPRYPTVSFIVSFDKQSLNFHELSVVVVEKVA